MKVWEQADERALARAIIAHTIPELRDAFDVWLTIRFLGSLPAKDVPEPGPKADQYIYQTLNGDYYTEHYGFVDLLTGVVHRYKALPLVDGRRHFAVAKLFEDYGFLIVQGPYFVMSNGNNVLTWDKALNRYKVVQAPPRYLGQPYPVELRWNVPFLVPEDR